MTTEEQFIEMAKGITRPGIDQMMAWLETTDFHLPIMEKLFGKNFFILAKTFVCSYVVIIALQRGLYIM